jgi:primosomal replication protein N
VPTGSSVNVMPTPNHVLTRGRLTPPVKADLVVWKGNVMFKGLVLVIIGIVAWFFIDSGLEYRYWKEEQRKGREVVKTALEHVKGANREQLETELKDVQSSFEKEGFLPSHDNVEKLARMFILADMLTPQSQNYYEYGQKYIRTGSGLRPGCHYEFLIHLYQKEAGLPELSPSNFCSGWAELDKDFTYGGTPPHARGELRY